MRLAASEYGNWFTDPELARLRREWIAAYRQWVQLDVSAAAAAVLTEDQRAILLRYHAAEAAYFARSRELAGGISAEERPPAHGTRRAQTGPAG